MIHASTGREAPAAAPAVFFVSADAEGALEALRRAAELRRAGIACDLDPRGGKLKAQFKQAERVGARYAVVLGGNEVRSGQASLKDLRSREETPVALAELAARLARP
jgi:histidyl-tRNA synthetase